jgi:hypothetical protein
VLDYLRFIAFFDCSCQHFLFSSSEKIALTCGASEGDDRFDTIATAIVMPCFRSMLRLVRLRNHFGAFFFLL